MRNPTPKTREDASIVSALTANWLSKLELFTGMLQRTKRPYVHSSAKVIIKYRRTEAVIQ